MEDETIQMITSSDGTAIRCTTQGEGPGIILLTGSNSASPHFASLAYQLSDSFTVHNVDRRGREGSGPQGDGYCMQREAEDIAAVLEQTKAGFLFGHSSGAVFAAQAALACSAVQKIALYEPPYGFSIDWLPEFQRLYQKRDVLGAQVTAMKGLNANPSIRTMPKWVMKTMLRLSCRGSARENLRKLLAPLAKELAELKKCEADKSQYQALHIPCLMLSGRESPEHMQKAADAFAALIPDCQRMRLPQLDHAAPITHADKVAGVLKKFFLYADE